MVAARSRGHGAARRMFFRATADMVPLAVRFSARLRTWCPLFLSNFSGKPLWQGLRVVCASAQGEYCAFLHVIPNECEGSPRLLQPIPCEGIPRRKSSNFAPMGLVRRIVEMLLQAGIPPRVGRNDGRMGARPNFAPMGLVRRIVEMHLQAGIPPRVGRNDKEQSLLKSRRKGCRARTSPDLTTLPPRFARHPPLHREGKDGG